MNRRTMRVLLTNDDGYAAPGLRAAWRALRALPGVEIDVIAPAQSHSGRGHVFSDVLRIHRRPLEDVGEGLIVEGTPVDCVCAGVHLPDRPRPDWVVAGINRGSNLGVDVYTSGTVAAARQAGIFGIPAVAVSQLVRNPLGDDWDQSVRLAAAVLAALIRPGTPPPPGADRAIHTELLEALRGDPHRELKSTPCWNVNLPRQAGGPAVLGARLVPLSRDPIHLCYDHTVEPDGEETLYYTGHYLERPAAPGTDVHAAFAGYVTLTRLSL